MQTASVMWIGEEKFVATSPSGHSIALDSDRMSNLPRYGSNSSCSTAFAVPSMKPLSSARFSSVTKNTVRSRLRYERAPR